MTDQSHVSWAHHTAAGNRCALPHLGLSVILIELSECLLHHLLALHPVCLLPCCP